MSRGCVTAISATHHILVFGYRLARVYEPRMQWQLSTRCGGQCSGLSRVKLLPAQRAAAWHRGTWRSVAAPLEEAVGRGDLAAVEVTAISATHHILVFGYRLARVYEPRMQWQLSTRCGGQCSGLSRVKLLPAQRAAAWHRWTWRSVAAPLEEAVGRGDLAAVEAVAGPRRVGFQRRRSADATCLAEVFRPVPNQVAEHRCVDPNDRYPLGKRSWQLGGYPIDALFGQPTQQSLVIRPVDGQETFVTAAQSVGVDFRLGR